MNTFCTIITSSHLPFALVLLESIQKYDSNVVLHLLVIDESKDSQPIKRQCLNYISLDELKTYELTNLIFKKYGHTNSDHFRWSLKPVLISYLLQKGFEKVIYVDCDVYFFNEFTFLFDELDHNAIILTPHWGNPWPLKNQEGFIQLLTQGVFNAGFLGANSNGLTALRWWAEACHFRMGHNAEYIVHDDQRYLDLVPLLFENVKILHHKGCNLMAGNYEECTREVVNSQVLISGVYPIVFIHFNKPLIQQILMGFDPLLVPYFEKYKMSFVENGVHLDDFLHPLQPYLHPTIFNKLKWRLHLRTRAKTLLFKLAEKL